MTSIDQVTKLLSQRIHSTINQGKIEIIDSPLYLDHFLRDLGFQNQSPHFQLLKKWKEDVWGLSFLMPFLREPETEEIILHHENSLQLIQRQKRSFHKTSFSSHEYQQALEWLALKNSQEWNQKKPCISFSGFVGDYFLRFTLLHHSITPHKRSKLFIRSLKKENYSLKDFSLTEGQEVFIKEMIAKQRNILISGSTGSGKTSFLKTLLGEVSPHEHVIILEDTYELKSNQTLFTHFLAKENEQQKSLLSFSHHSLRLRPDRMVIGETRGAEVVPVILSLNTGHRGFMTSLHANSAIETISRLATLFQVYSHQSSIHYQEVLKMICRGIDVVIHLREKRVEQMISVLGSEGSTPYYKSLEP